MKTWNSEIQFIWSPSNVIFLSKVGPVLFVMTQHDTESDGWTLGGGGVTCNVIWHPSKQVRFKQITETLERQSKQTEQFEREQWNQACVHTERLMRGWAAGEEIGRRHRWEEWDRSGSLHALRHFLLSWSSPTEAGLESCVAFWESILKTRCACFNLIMCTQFRVFQVWWWFTWAS